MAGRKRQPIPAELRPRAELLRDGMRRTGLRPAELGRAAGVSRPSVCRLLHSQTLPSADTALQLARALRLPVADVLAAAGHPGVAACFRERDSSWQAEFQRLTRLMGITLMTEEIFAALHRDDQKVIVSQLVALKLLCDRLLGRPALVPDAPRPRAIRATVVNESV